MSRHELHPIHIICDRVAEEAANQAAVFTAEEARRWPTGFLHAAMASRLLYRIKDAERIECRGCSRRCSRPIEDAMTGSDLPKRFFLTCELRDDVSCFSVAPERMQRFVVTTRRIIELVARELNLPLPVFPDVNQIIRLGTYRRPGVRRVIAIEFADQVRLLAGEARIELSEIMKWSGDRLALDLEELDLRARAYPDVLIGNKRYQSSRARQRFKAQLTELRNRKLQTAADKLKRANPTWKKSAIAAAIVTSGEFPDLRGRATVERILRIARK